MRFFTDHFFSEEQKMELLCGKYKQQVSDGKTFADQQPRYINFERSETQQRLQRELEEFDKRARLVDMVLLPLILTITLGLGIASSFLMDGPI